MQNQPFGDRLADMWREAFLNSGLSQRELSKQIGVSRAAMQNWADGTTAPDLKTTLKALSKIPNVTIFPALLKVVFPELFSLKETAEKRAAVVRFYKEIASPLFIEQEYYILFGQHGSSHLGLKQMCVAHLQSTLSDRRKNCHQCIQAYQDAQTMGMLTDPHEVQPDMEILTTCFDRSTESVLAGRSGYTIAGDKVEV